MWSSSLASASSEFKYDVFLILRDANGCVGNKLRDAGITALVEDEDEEEEGFSVHEAAEKSRIIVVLFTPEFLESEMCLKRLKVRINWWNTNLLAVYCAVSRQQVHEKLGALFVRFASVPALKLSLDFRSNISSSCTANLGLSMLHDESFHDLPDHQVGLSLRVRELLNILGLKYNLSDDTITVKIWGDEGIGKSTIAEAIYDRIGGNFEGKSFLSNIKDVWEEDNGNVLLKKQLISDIFGIELDATNAVVHEQMKQVLCGRRVLVVLDDVNSEFQLEELCGNVKWSNPMFCVEVVNGLVQAVE